MASKPTIFGSENTRNTDTTNKEWSEPAAEEKAKGRTVARGKRGRKEGR
jgi:hypothetical protein